MKMEIFAIDKDGERFEITDLYWFEENFVHDFDSGDRGYRFEFIIDGTPLTKFMSNTAKGLTTDEAIAAIQKAIDAHAPGTWDNGLRLAKYLHEQAERIKESVSDDMSARRE